MTNYRDRLRRLAVNEPNHLSVELSAIPHLDAKMLATARLAALIAVGGSGPTFGEYTDAALSAGANSDEIVDVLVGIGSVVGVPRVVSAASELALALGIDVDRLES
jgi:alkylhydroperoxidase/carboxymuconolactone decarboxylase family protein YurZ